ncbi:MAG: hypothetical protein IJU38_07095 [Clostridia bacterium]|nr:hypothetical protein [Clostridia bacterium]
MAIALAKNYTDLLDQEFKKDSVTARLNGDPAFTREGADANEIYYPEIETGGLGDYSRTAGYPDGSVALVWKHATFNYDRGTRIMVDNMDNQETFNLAFGKAGQELQRTKVAPEADAFTFATLAGLTGITAPTAANLASADAFLAALLAATDQMDDDEVPSENRYLFATPSLVNSLMALDTYKSKEVIAQFSEVVKVPKSRFLSAIDMKSGRADDNYIGHYTPGEGAKYLNFVIVHKPSLIKYDKHVANNLLAPGQHTLSDGYVLMYRKYGIVDVYENQREGVYVHTSATAAQTGSN